jgi:hypothetical protein
VDVGGAELASGVELASSSAKGGWGNVSVWNSDTVKDLKLVTYLLLLYL